MILTMGTLHSRYPPRNILESFDGDQIVSFRNGENELELVA